MRVWISELSALSILLRCSILWSWNSGRLRGLGSPSFAAFPSHRIHYMEIFFSKLSLFVICRLLASLT